MAQTTLILSSSSLSITVANNKGYIYYDDELSKYIAARTYSQKSSSIQASLPTNLSNITVTNVTITQQLSYTGGTAWRYTTDEDIKEQLNSGIVTLPISFIYAPNNDNGQYTSLTDAQNFVAASANSKTCSISQITITIDYTKAESSTTQRISYKLAQTSIAYNEYLKLQIEYTPTSTIAAGNLKAKVYNATANKEISYILNAQQALTANTFYSFSCESRLSETISSNLTTGNKIKIYIEGETESIIDEALSNFIFVSARTAPNLTLTWDSTTYLSYIQAPIVTLSNITLDSTTDAALKSVVINFSNSELGQITLLPNAGVQEISPFIVSSDISNPSYTIIITDSYNQTTINSITPTNLTIKLYESPSFADNFNIKRYVFNSLTNLNEITSDGTKLLVDGTINIFKDCTVKRLQFSYIDDNTNEQTLWFDIPAGQTTNQYALNKNTSIFSSSGTPLIFAADKTYSITVKLIDDYSVITTTIDVQKAEGYFNIEKYGVAVGGIAHGKENDKQFECYYPMYFYNNGNKYRIAIGNNNNLIAELVEASDDTPVTNQYILFESNENNIIKDSTDSLTYTLPGALGTLTWKKNYNITNTTGDTLASFSKNYIKLEVGTNSSAQYIAVRGQNNILIPNTAKTLKAIVRPSTAISNGYCYFGLLDSTRTISRSDIAKSTPIDNDTDGLTSPVIYLTNTSHEVQISLDLENKTSVLGKNRSPFILLRRDGTATAWGITIIKVWLE